MKLRSSKSFPVPDDAGYIGYLEGVPPPHDGGAVRFDRRLNSTEDGEGVPPPHDGEANDGANEARNRTSEVAELRVGEATSNGATERVRNRTSEVAELRVGEATSNGATERVRNRTSEVAELRVGEATSNGATQRVRNEVFIITGWWVLFMGMLWAGRDFTNVFVLLWCVTLTVLFLMMMIIVWFGIKIPSYNHGETCERCECGHGDGNGDCHCDCHGRLN